MAHENGRTRTVVRCESCEAVYPAWEWPDGTIRIIGREGCACGSADLEEIESASALSSEDDAE